MTLLLAILPWEWPSGQLTVESWAAGSLAVPRFSKATLEIEGPGAWVAAVPGHWAAGAQRRGSFYGVLEAGFLSGPDAVGTRAWNTEATGFLPAYEVSAGFTRAFAGVRARGEEMEVSADFGVDKRWFGQLLSRGLPLSGLRAQADGGRWAFQYQVLELSDYIADTTRWFKEGWVQQGEVLRRFLTVRRVEWAPRAWLTLSFTEASVYSTRHALPRLGYLNPLMPAYVWQWNTGDDNNALWSFGAAWRARPGLALFLEFLVDDAQFNPDYWDDAPPDFGVSGEVLWLPGRWGLSAGFQGASTWCYNNSRPWDKYWAWEEPLGPPPDWQEIWLKVWRRGGWRPGAGLILKSKGSVSLSREDPGLGNYPRDFWLLDPVETRLVPVAWLEGVREGFELKVSVDGTPGAKLWLVIKR